MTNEIVISRVGGGNLDIFNKKTTSRPFFPYIIMSCTSPRVLRFISSLVLQYQLGDAVYLVIGKLVV